MAKATILQAVVAVLLLCFIGEGLCTCTHSIKDITVSQAPTGQAIHGEPEYKVTVTNVCEQCSMVQVSLSCPGFKTTEEIDPSVMDNQGDSCVLQQVGPARSVEFNYASDTTYPFTPESATVGCS